MTHSNGSPAFDGAPEATTASFPCWEGLGARYQQREGSRRAVAVLAADMAGEDARLVADTLIHPLIDVAETYLATAMAQLAAALRQLPEGRVPGLDVVDDGAVPTREELPELWAAVSVAAAAVWPAPTTTDQAARKAIEFLLSVRGAPSVNASDIAAAVEVTAVFLEGGETGAQEMAAAQAEYAEYAAEMREQY
jgi:hypothetical protein